MQASELLKRIKSKAAPVVIDARSEIEFKRGHIPGAINAPVRALFVRHEGEKARERHQERAQCDAHRLASTLS